MIDRISNPKEFAKFQTGGSLKARQKKRVEDDELAFYHDPDVTLISYINDMVTDIERARFFNKVGTKRPKKGYEIDGKDIEDHLGNILWKNQNTIDIFRDEVISDVSPRLFHLLSSSHKPFRFLFRYDCIIVPVGHMVRLDGIKIPVCRIP